jgi:hypothetical protein
VVLWASFLVACGSSESGEDASSGGTPSATGGATGGRTADFTGGTTTGGTAAAGTGGRVGTGGSTGGSASDASGGITGGASSPTEPLPPTDVPVIDAVFAAIDEQGAIAVKFEGRTAAAPASTVNVGLLDAEGNEIGLASGWGSWLARPNRLLRGGSAGNIEQVGNTFSGFISSLDESLVERPERVRVTMLDRNQALSDPVEAVLEAPAPEARAEGAACDPFEILDRCGEGALCDVVNGAGRVAPTCQIPEPTCPLDLPELHGSVEGDNSELLDTTDSSCTFTRGQLGNDEGHAFVATRSGTHRFRAEEIDYQVAITLFVRSICDFGRAGDSELGCVHLNDAGEGMPLVLDIDLEAGQTVFVYVESSWVSGGKYVLSVEEPD